MTVSEQLKAMVALVPPKKQHEMRLIVSQVERMELWSDLQSKILDQGECMGLHPHDFVRWLKRQKGISGIWEVDGMRISISIGDDK